MHERPLLSSAWGLGFLLINFSAGVKSPTNASLASSYLKPVNVGVPSAVESHSEMLPIIGQSIE